MRGTLVHAPLPASGVTLTTFDVPSRVDTSRSLPSYSHCIPFCVYLHAHVSPFYTDTSHNGFGAPLIQYDLILANYTCMAMSQWGRILRQWRLGLYTAILQEHDSTHSKREEKVLVLNWESRPSNLSKQTDATKVNAN